MKELLINLAGFGTVGFGVWDNLQKQSALLSKRTGCRIKINLIALRNIATATRAGIPKKHLTKNVEDLVNDPKASVLVELIGGTTTAYTLVKSALKRGKHVVTANKALMAAHGEELLSLAAKNGCHLLFEASVAGGIPIIKSLCEGLIANNLMSLHGIINGTCNYILSRMSEASMKYEDALKEAKAKGYAEADESLDVGGDDSAHKALILAALAYGHWPHQREVFTEGIQKIHSQDIAFAKDLGYTLKLLAIIKSDKKNRFELRVHPTLIPQKNILASVSDSFNAVAVRGDVLGDSLFYGRGAGANPTASAVIADIAEIACGTSHPPAAHFSTKNFRLKPMGEVVSRYYLRLNVQDRPGVLAKVASLLASKKIGISSVIQPEGHEGDILPLIIMLHDAVEKDFQEVRKKIEHLSVVSPPSVVIRVEDFS